MTNWQLLQILEQKGKPEISPEEPQRSPEESKLLPEDYYLVRDWGDLKRGTKIKYQTNGLGSPHTIYDGWFQSLNSYWESVEMISNEGRKIALPLRFIQRAWYYSVDEEVSCFTGFLSMF